MIIIGNLVPDLVSIFMRVKGITIFPFIFLRPTATEININHEKIHIRQQLELLVVLFYVLYFLDYAIGIIKYRNTRLAYKNITWEKEAYANQENFAYLKRRKWYAFVKYIK